MPSPEHEALVQIMKSRLAPETVTIEALGQGYDLMGQLDPTPADVKVEQADADGISVEVITAPGAGDGATIIWFHGGGYTIGSHNSHRTMISRISRASGARALSVDYRLAPKHRFPAALDDGLTVYRWLLSAGADPQRIVVGGDSAGGGLAIALMVSLRDGGEPLPGASVGMSTWCDLTMSGNSVEANADTELLVPPRVLTLFADAYMGEEDRANPFASPVFADLSGLPPLLLLVSDAESLLDDSKALANAARAAGVDVSLEVSEGLIHHWPIYAGNVPEGQQAIDRIGEFVRAQLNGS
jgi:acetyl esterase/lipase